MAIPSNLLPINNPLREEISEQITTVPSVTNTRLPSNLLPVNTSDISGSLQSLTGNIPTITTPEIPQFSILNTVIPDRLFTTGSIDQVRERTLNAARTYTSGLPALPAIPTVPTLIVPKLRIPSYGQIKNYIKTKIDKIKQQRQKASVRALDQELKKQENPFKYRESLKNVAQKSSVNTVLGRYNNQ
jgi:hypothetical protein